MELSNSDQELDEKSAYIKDSICRPELPLSGI